MTQGTEGGLTSLSFSAMGILIGNWIKLMSDMIRAKRDQRVWIKDKCCNIE